MQALRTSDRTSPEALSLGDAPDPSPGTDDVLIAVRGASYTRGELTWPSTWVDRRGLDRTPIVPGHEVSGVVAAVGFGVVRWAVGDEVYGLTDWYRDGTLAELVAVQARDIVRKPAGIDHPSAATLPLAGLTAWQGLFTHGQLAPEESVLITGAGGAVGSVAVQLAHAAGAHVVGLCRAADADRVRRLGADVVLAPDERLGDIHPVRLVFDTVGGAVASRAAARAARGGTVVSIADPGPIRSDQVRFVFFVVDPDPGTLTELAHRVEAGTLMTPGTRRVTLAEAPAAIAGLESGAASAKLAVDVSGDTQGPSAPA